MSHGAARRILAGADLGRLVPKNLRVYPGGPTEVKPPKPQDVSPTSRVTPHPFLLLNLVEFELVIIQTIVAQCIKVALTAICVVL